MLLGDQPLMSDRIATVLVPQFARYIVRPALHTINLYSRAAELLVLGTAAQESQFTAIAQIGMKDADKGGLGYWQMEASTHDDIWRNSLTPELRGCMSLLLGHPASVTGASVTGALIGNLYYAAAMCRLAYYRAPFRMLTDDELSKWSTDQLIKWLAATWKTYYNTALGKGTVEEFEGHYRDLVLPYHTTLLGASSTG